MLLMIATGATERSEVAQGAMMKTLGMSGIRGTAGTHYSGCSYSFVTQSSLKRPKTYATGEIFERSIVTNCSATGLCFAPLLR